MLFSASHQCQCTRVLYKSCSFCACAHPNYPVDVVRGGIMYLGSFLCTCVCVCIKLEAFPTGFPSSSGLHFTHDEVADVGDCSVWREEHSPSRLRCTKRASSDEDYPQRRKVDLLDRHAGNDEGTVPQTGGCFRVNSTGSRECLSVCYRLHLWERFQLHDLLTLIFLRVWVTTLACWDWKSVRSWSGVGIFRGSRMVVQSVWHRCRSRAAFLVFALWGLCHSLLYHWKSSWLVKKYDVASIFVQWVLISS